MSRPMRPMTPMPAPPHQSVKAGTAWVRVLIDNVDVPWVKTIDGYGRATSKPTAEGGAVSIEDGPGGGGRMGGPGGGRGRRRGWGLPVSSVC